MEFKDIYEKICENGNEILKQAKKQKKSRILKTIIICFFVNLIFYFLDKELIFLPLTISLSALVLLLVIHKESQKYRNLYKDFVIKELVINFDNKLNYNSQEGIIKSDYNLSHFEIDYDEFFSKDRIFGKLVKDNYIEMAHVITKQVKREKDADGNEKTERIETFNGIYGFVRLEKNSNANIHIANNSITKKYNAKRIEIDSAEFEQNFDCLTEDKIIALKILTSDLIEEFVKLKREDFKGFEVKIINDMIFFRFRSGQIFEPPKIKKDLDEELIRKYYNSIVFPISLMENLIKNVNKL